MRSIRAVLRPRRISLGLIALIGTYLLSCPASDIGKPHGYSLYGGHAAFNPADATTYFWGLIDNSIPLVAATNLDWIVEFPGQVTSVQVIWRMTAGSAENVNVWIRLNNTTDYCNVTPTFNNPTVESLMCVGTPFAVAFNDHLEMKMTTPTWAANPINVISGVIVNIEQ